jgi:hypothetical protein
MLLISGDFGALDPKSWLDETYSALLKKEYLLMTRQYLPYDEKFKKPKRYRT